MEPQRTRSLWALALLAGVLLLALGLRLYRIDAQSLWNDEGTSVALAARDLAAITRGAANDIHPPLYYYLLHFWIALFGQSELVVRSLSALLGTLVVLLVFALGYQPEYEPNSVSALPSQLRANRQFSLPPSYWTALLAALFAALSPFQIYYSQEARMYILTAFLGTVSVYAFLRLLSAWQNARGAGGRPPSDIPRKGGTDNVAPPVVTPSGGVAPAERLPRKGGTEYLLYAVATILLLYSHYFAATVIVVENLAFLWWLFTVRHIRRWLLRWVALQAVVGAFYLPWLVLTREQLRVWPAISQPLTLTRLLLDLLRVFSLGLSVPTGANLVLLGFATLLLAGIVVALKGARRAQDGTPCALCLLYLFIPIGVMYLLSLRRPMYNPKFLLLCSVPFSLLLAHGAQYVWSRTGRLAMSDIRSESRGRRWPWLGKILALAAAVFVVTSSVYSLRAYYFDSRYARDDYRAIAQYIQAVERQGDAVLINAPSQIETFVYYYRGELPLYPLPLQRPLDEARTLADLQRMVEGRARIFAVLWATDESDPGRFVEGWLDQYTYKAMDSWYGNVRLAVYAVPEEPVTDHIEFPLRVDLGATVRLLGYNLPRTPVPRAQGGRLRQPERGTEYLPSAAGAGGALEVMPGDILQLTLVWQAVAPMTERYKVFTHVLDPYGHLVGQRDAEPGGGVKITTTWREGEQVVDNYGLPILPATPPGDYSIEIGMYGLSDGRRLPITRDGQAIGDSIVLQSVRVLPAPSPPPLSVLGMRGQLDVRFGNVTLLGYDLAKLGQEHQPDAPIQPGDILHLTLFWQARAASGENLAVLLRLQDATGKTWLERRAQPTEGLYPTGQWRVNEIIRDQHNLFLPPDLPAGKSYRLVLAVEQSTGAQVGTPYPLLRDWKPGSPAMPARGGRAASSERSGGGTQ